MSESANKLRAKLPTLVVVLILIVTVVLVYRFISSRDTTVKKERKIQTVTITQPPPPPPPPPPKVEKPPEPVPEKEPMPEPDQPEEKVEQEEPEPEKLPDVAEQAPGDSGVDAEGVAGSDAFGLVGRPGGNGLFGGGGGGGGSSVTHYANFIKNELTDLLSENDVLRHKAYNAVIKLWIESDGKVSRFELSKGTSDREIDELINKVIATYNQVKEPQPKGIAMPIKFKINNTM